jgi:Spy/CpxP family protein refolding chaperone
MWRAAELQLLTCSFKSRVMCVLILSCASINFCLANDSAASTPGNTTMSHRHQVNGIEDRVAKLSTALNLDSSQQQQLRQILQHQRELVRKVWNDTSTPSSYRVIATRAISDQTSDQIRAMLNEEQLKQYNPPRPKRESDAPNVEQWMSPAQHPNGAPVTTASRKN